MEDPALDDQLPKVAPLSVILPGRQAINRFILAVCGDTRQELCWGALHWLSEAPHGLIQADLAQRLGVNASTIVRLIDGMEADGFVSRRRIVGDRRSNYVMIEAPGHARLARFNVTAVRLRDEIFAGIEERDIEAFRRVLFTAYSRLPARGEEQASAAED